MIPEKIQKQEMTEYDAFNPPVKEQRKSTKWTKLLNKIADGIAVIGGKLIGILPKLIKIFKSDTVRLIGAVLLIIIIGTGLYYNIKWAIIYWPITLSVIIILLVWSTIVRIKKSMQRKNK